MKRALLFLLLLSAPILAKASGFLPGSTITGDLYTDAFQAYSDTSTISGWTSFTTKHVYYKRVGKLVFVWFVLDGTSNSATTNFTVPYTISNTVQPVFLTRSKDNGATIVTGLARGGINTKTVTLNADPAATAYTASGAKLSAGHFFYETSD